MKNTLILSAERLKNITNIASGYISKDQALLEDFISVYYRNVAGRLAGL